MTKMKVPLIIVFLTLVVGTIVGYGIRGADRHQPASPDSALPDMISRSTENLIEQMTQNKKAIDDLSLRVYFLRKKMDESLSRPSSDASLNEETLEDLSRRINDLGRKINRPPDKSFFQQARKVEQDMQPVRKTASALKEPLIEHLYFAYGNSLMSRTGQDRLDALLRILPYDSGVRVDITAYVDAEGDGSALQEHLFREKLKIQKLKDMIINGLPPVPVEDVIISEKEYEKYLNMAYDSETFTKPANILGLPRSLSVEGMEDLIRTHITVTAEDLESIASDRASTVQDYIMKANKVAPDNISSRVLPLPPGEQQSDQGKDFAVLKVVMSPSAE